MESSQPLVEPGGASEWENVFGTVCYSAQVICKISLNLHKDLTNFNLRADDSALVYFLALASWQNCDFTNWCCWCVMTLSWYFNVTSQSLNNIGLGLGIWTVNGDALIKYWHSCVLSVVVHEDCIHVTFQVLKFPSNKWSLMDHMYAAVFL